MNYILERYIYAENAGEKKALCRSIAGAKDIKNSKLDFNIYFCQKSVNVCLRGCVGFFFQNITMRFQGTIRITYFK